MSTSRLTIAGPMRSTDASPKQVGIGRAATRTVKKAGHPVPLTPLEFKVLLAILKRRGAVVSHLDLLTG